MNLVDGSLECIIELVLNPENNKNDKEHGNSIEFSIESNQVGNE